MKKSILLNSAVIFGTLITFQTSVQIHAESNLTLKPEVSSVVLPKAKVDYSNLPLVSVLSKKTAEPEPQASIDERNNAQKQLEKKAIEDAQQKTEELKAKALADWETSFPKVSAVAVTENFLNSIAKDAVEIARRHNIFPSVLMAQATLESGSGRSGLGQAPNYNLFGIKGSYKGASVGMSTKEHVGGGTITINAGFRKYSSWKESMEDYATLLSGGLDYSPDFYTGTWRSNSATYREATACLAGRYASSPSYAEDLNSFIASNNLQRFDDIKPLDLSSIKVEPVVEKASLPKDVYVVKSEDSLMSIAMRHNTTVFALINENKLEDSVVYINQQIKIPVPSQNAKRHIEEKKAIVETTANPIIEKAVKTMKN